MRKIFIALVMGLAAGHATEHQESMDTYTIALKPSIQIIGIACKTSNDIDAGPKDIPQHWGKFLSENVIAKIPGKTSNAIIALYCDYEGDHTKPYTFILGCPVSSLDEIPEGMVAKTLPASSYAAYCAKGTFPKSVIETWGTIWQTPLKRTYTGDFEFYPEDFAASQEVGVFVAVE